MHHHVGGASASGRYVNRREADAPRVMFPDLGSDITRWVKAHPTYYMSCYMLIILTKEEI